MVDNRSREQRRSKTGKGQSGSLIADHVEMIDLFQMA